MAVVKSIILYNLTRYVLLPLLLLLPLLRLLLSLQTGLSVSVSSTM